MRGNPPTTITTSDSPYLTSLGKMLRKYKLDEIPQLLNIILGQMSFVGPRPDVPGYADLLAGDDRRMLEVKPGIFGPAQLKYKDEEILLSQQKKPITYNDEVIWPDKVRINLEYAQNWSFQKDIAVILQTLSAVFLSTKNSKSK